MEAKVEVEKNKNAPLTEARIMGIVMEDIIFRSPVYGIIVLLLLGSLGFFFVWLVLYVLRPLILG